ncbi:hypothetical protein, partial [Comamonas thiooxydans]|uniref:hypothetical protein n=1 Tax=Comamonas thiooxydans TaxID=363952 RepID=UPI001C0E9BB1
VVGQQARQQFFGYVVFLGAHCAYGQSGLRRRLIVRLHKILHTLDQEADGVSEDRCVCGEVQGCGWAGLNLPFSRRKIHRLQE